MHERGSTGWGGRGDEGGRASRVGLGGRRGKGGGRRRQPEGEGRGGVADNARDVGERAVAARRWSTPEGGATGAGRAVRSTTASTTAGLSKGPGYPATTTVGWVNCRRGQLRARGESSSLLHACAERSCLKSPRAMNPATYSNLWWSRRQTSPRRRLARRLCDGSATAKPPAASRPVRRPPRATGWPEQGDARNFGGRPERARYRAHLCSLPLEVMSSAAKGVYRAERGRRRPTASPRERRTAAAYTRRCID